MFNRNFTPYKYPLYVPSKDEPFDTEMLFSKDYFLINDTKCVPIVLAKEINSFLSSTQHMISFYADQFINPTKFDYDLLIEYMKEWGPPLLISGDEQYTEKDFYDAFCAACYTAEMILSLWCDDTTQKIDILSTCAAISNITHGLKDTALVFWNMKDRSKNGRLTPTWQYDGTGFYGYWKDDMINTFNSFLKTGTFLPVEFHVNAEEINMLYENRNNSVFCRNWLKIKFLHVLADNITQSEFSAKSYVNGEQVFIDFFLHNNLLFYIKHTIDRANKLCAFCHKPLKEGRTKYCSDDCYRKQYNTANPCRGIKQTLTSRFQRHKKITFEQLDVLHNMVSDLYKNEKMTADEIKSIVYNRYDEFVRNNEYMIGEKNNATKDTKTW